MKRRRESGVIFRILADAWLIGATREGKVLAGSILAAASVASASLDIPVYQFLALLCGFAVVTWVVARAYRPRVILRGAPPAKGMAGQPVSVSLIMENVSRRTYYDVSAGFLNLPDGVETAQPALLVPRLAPGQTATVNVAIRAPRRGLYSLPGARAFSTFPLNLYRARAPWKRGDDRHSPFLVYPMFHRLTGFNVPVRPRYQPGGITLSSLVGESPEYIGNRPYRPGDSPRHLDFNAWARLAEPIVREFHEEYYSRIALVVDTYVSRWNFSRLKPIPNLEAGVSLAASVVDALERGEFIIDIFAAGPELHVWRAGRHTTNFENVLELLACVEPCTRNPFDLLTPALAEELGSISTIVCILLDWDASREALVTMAAECGCRLKVVIIRDGETTLPYEHLVSTFEILACTPAAVTAGQVESL